MISINRLMHICVLLLICVSGSLLYAQAPRVNVMPDGVYNPADAIYTAYAMPESTLTIWGNVVDGVPPYNYEWDFGDGTSPVGGSVSNPRDIAVTHAYNTMGPKYATLVVTDNNGASDMDIVRIDVVPAEMWVRKNLAIEKGLRWLYLHNYSSISWQGWSANSEGSYRVGAFGMEVLAFENRGHLPNLDPDEDIYTEYVQQGLDIILSLAHVQSGIGIYFSDGTRPLYETGIAMMALVGSRDPSLTAATGPAGVNGETYYNIVSQAVEYLAWAQNEGGGRGGWRYYPNYGSSDNSVSQWPAIGLEAAEHDWGIAIPEFVKTELVNYWIPSSQNGNGGFGYSSTSGPNVGRTGAGLCEMAFGGIPYGHTRFQNALQYICNSWNQPNSVTDGNLGNYYAMYGVAKGCRIAIDEFGVPHPIVYICSYNWQQVYDSYLISHQFADGHWDGSNYGSTVLDTDFGLLILIPSITQVPVAVIDGPVSVPANTPFALDGRESYHTDSTRNIVEWWWDFDASDGYSWNSGPPDASGDSVTCPGYDIPVEQLPTTRVVTLMVRDDGTPPKTDIDELIITVDTSNHPPIAIPGGPYAAKVGEWITFDGTGSYDNDSGDYIDSYFWDLNGDGVFPPDDITGFDCTDPTCQRKWDIEYSGQIGLIVVDSRGATSKPSGAYVTIWTSRVDAEVHNADIFFSNDTPSPGEMVTLSAVIHCDPESDPISNVRVRFYDGVPKANPIGDDHVIPLMTAGQVDTVSVSWITPDSLPRMIYVQVDPDGEIEEFDEDDNQAFKSIGSLAAGVLKLKPEPMYVYYIMNIGGMMAEIYMGDFTMGFTADDVDPATVLINDSLVIASSEIVTDNSIFTGDIFKMTVPISDFLLGYGFVLDTSYQTCMVSGNFLSGQIFTAEGQFILIGHISGDVNFDGQVNIGDAVYLVNYVFGDGPPPSIMEVADTNCDGNIDVGDIVFLINYIYRDGPRPGCH